jgi:hypothetical protein
MRLKALTAAACIMCAPIAYAAMPPTLIAPTELSSVAIDTACDAVPGPVATASLTCVAYEIKSDTLDEIRINMFYDYGAATAVQMYIDSSDSGASTGDTPFFTESLGDAGAAPPAIAMGAQYLEWTGTADWYQTVLLNGPFAKWTRFRFTATSGNPNDLIDATLEVR